ncbi:MAG: hypothetical protein SGI74_07360 [Oligoflexia bacterium]|nr:hypothetical protein [Oligoflexia bacterium]
MGTLVRRLINKYRLVVLASVFTSLLVISQISLADTTRDPDSDDAGDEPTTDICLSLFKIQL